MIVGVCGFGSSGSSAVADYLKEFESTEVLDNTEFQLVTYPDGIESLDYYLNENISKYTSSDIAIIRFIRFVNNISLSMNKVTNDQFSNLSREYIDSITQISWRGYGASDNALNSGWIYKNFTCRLIKARLIPLYEKVFKKTFDHYPVRNMYFSVCPDEFIDKTKTYIDAVISAMGREDPNKITVLNQPFAGNNPVRSFRYFDEPYAIVVDRDPRDMYLFAKKFLFRKGRAIPSDNVENFVEYYKRLRNGQPYQLPDKRVLRIQFEELVYNYEHTTCKIREFCGLDMKDHSRTILVPERSANNTMLFNKYKGFEKDIEYITEKLPEYIFDFDRYPRIETSGGMFYGRSELNTGDK